MSINNGPASGPSSLTLRYARLDDAQQVCEVHRSHTDRWYRVIDNEQYEVPYHTLSITERWGFGGPWMSIETCAIHLNNLILRHQYPIVVEEKERLFGHMEVFIGREGAPFGRNAHIGVLYVRKDHVRSGIGSKLIDKAISIARENFCDTLTVSSGQHNEQFYEKCGFLPCCTMVEAEAVTEDYNIDLEPFPAPSRLQPFLWGKTMAIGRYQSSAFSIFESSDEYAIPQYLDIRQKISPVKVNGKPALFLFYIRSPSNVDAVVHGWTDNASTSDMIFAALKLLHSMGIKYAHILLSMTEYNNISKDINAAIKGSRITLVYPLRK